MGRSLYSYKGKHLVTTANPQLPLVLQKGKLERVLTRPMET